METQLDATNGLYTDPSKGCFANPLEGCFADPSEGCFADQQITTIKAYLSKYKRTDDLLHTYPIDDLNTIANIINGDLSQAEQSCHTLCYAGIYKYVTNDLTGGKTYIQIAMKTDSIFAYVIYGHSVVVNKMKYYMYAYENGYTSVAYEIGMLYCKRIDCHNTWFVNSTKYLHIAWKNGRTDALIELIRVYSSCKSNCEDAYNYDIAYAYFLIAHKMKLISYHYMSEMCWYPLQKMYLLNGITEENCAICAYRFAMRYSNNESEKRKYLTIAMQQGHEMARTEFQKMMDENKQSVRAVVGNRFARLFNLNFISFDAKDCHKTRTMDVEQTEQDAEMTELISDKKQK